MPQNETQARLTRKERELLNVLVDPQSRFLTVTDICRKARCSRDTYYRAFEKPQFVEEYKRQSKKLAIKHLGPVMNAFVSQACRGSYQHGKAILEMAGIFDALELKREELELRKEIEHKKNW
jgi:hypothetical protein